MLLNSITGTKTGATLRFAVRDGAKVFSSLSQLVPSNCPVGPTSTVPGILFQTQQFPQDIESITKESFAPLKQIYLHSLELGGLASLENTFLAYLRRLCSSEQRLEDKGLNSTTRNAMI